MGRGGSFRNDFLEAKVAMVVVGRRGKQADEVTAFATRGRVQRTPASFYGSISVYSRSTRARLPDERKNVGRCVGSVKRLDHDSSTFVSKILTLFDRFSSHPCIISNLYLIYDTQAIHYLVAWINFRKCEV